MSALHVRRLVSGVELWLVCGEDLLLIVRRLGYDIESLVVSVESDCLV